MTVVTRNRTDPFDSRVLRPGLAAEGAEVEASRNGVAHERQARVAADDHVFRHIVKHCRHQALCLGKSVEHAVVAAVGAVLGDAILRAGDAGEQRQAQIELLGARFAASHIQRKALCFELRVLFLQSIELALKLRAIHLFECSHFPSFAMCDETCTPPRILPTLILRLRARCDKFQLREILGFPSYRASASTSTPASAMPCPCERRQ